MVRKYSFAECIARPDGVKGEKYSLQEHLLAVAQKMGEAEGNAYERLRFLAGLLHDAGKTQTAWQEYVRQPDKLRGVPHAYAGAMLFAVCLDQLLKIWQPKMKEKQALLRLGVGLTHYLYNHHGEVPDINGEYPPWVGRYVAGDLINCDLKAIFTLTGNYFPELNYFVREDGLLTAIESTLADITVRWPKWCNEAIKYSFRLLEQGNRYIIGASLALQLENSRLICADRVHAAGFLTEDSPEEYITSECARQILQSIDDFCKKRRQALEATGAAKLLLDGREKWRQKALKEFSKEAGANVFTLELPTGYGKTLTSLSIALKAIEQGLCRKIIYVAPYLSILSQATEEIARSTGLEVMTHHYLSALNRLFEDEKEKEEDILLETWRAPVVTTTFNQLFLALFPSRAQHTLRLEGLKDAFIIIDEPQILSANVWNLFLALLEACTRELNTKVLLTTATLPALEGGLFGQVVSLGKAVPILSRYSVTSLSEINEQHLAEEAVQAYRDYRSVSVILNTIKDAARVYHLIKELIPEEPVFFLSGRLTPLHKKARVDEIKNALATGKGVLVVSTQVLEAGVDLSFRVVLRARPVIPSIVQAAGRANRHGEGEIGNLYVVDFRRENEIDTRCYVYRDRDQREVTDWCLTKYTKFTESEAARIIRDYYDECFRRNTHQAILEKVIQAAAGHYSTFAGLHPFGTEIFQYGVFVPHLICALPETLKNVMTKFNIDTPEQIWERYVARGYLNSLKFRERKAFMGLMNYFTVHVPEKVASKVGEAVEGKMLLRLKQDAYYKTDTGLSLIEAEDEQEVWFI
ncbi:Type III restriction enzyme, res subunit [Neomoorella glycerini]|uniref:Type III restriction enzyme, res subunit n=1 Tax=Neomoorella glycerini TaxID=55779 RepID=A0A6I5ZRQ4_9FIRM|nr:CRISPR-associated helicase Cas3' [Moorella glycerini]QGP92359.1 Type III restriction enzyme, res subunit [Moorella glycerini]